MAMWRYQPTFTRLHLFGSLLTDCLVSTYHSRWQKTPHTIAGRAKISYYRGLSN